MPSERMITLSESELNNYASKKSECERYWAAGIGFGAIGLLNALAVSVFYHTIHSYSEFVALGAFCFVASRSSFGKYSRIKRRLSDIMNLNLMEMPNIIYNKNLEQNLNQE